jgi:hypothetical protein
MLIQKAKEKLIELVKDSGLLEKEIDISCKALTKEEAIGNPLHDDYPISMGKEKIIEAHLSGKRGQAFCDVYFNYNGKIKDLLELDLNSNARRAIFISSLNVILSVLGLIPEVVHCKDNDFLKCADHFSEFIKNIFKNQNKFLLIGLQPRLLSALANLKQVRVCDKNPDNIGSIVCGIQIDEPEKCSQHIKWADIVVATGSTIVNNTIDEIYHANPDTYFFGVTITGVAYLLGLNKFCYIMEE